MGFRILLVDDDPQVLKLFSVILTGGGHVVRSEITGKGAIQVLGTGEQVDLMVLDLNMPAPDGFEVLKAAREHRPGLRVLVTSGFMEGAFLKASEFLGATASLNKTDATRLLLPKVNELLRR
jgi:CheY-like chemotaxis protein